MFTTANSPIYYGYDGSPFVNKLETILLLKNIPARRVDVTLTAPRPELSSLLGLPYKRVPVLALGRDVYIDTTLITSALEQHFPSPQHPTIFPPQKGSGKIDVGMQKAFVKFYADKHLLKVGFELLPWTKLSPKLLAQRKKFLDRDVGFDALAQQRSITESTLVSHLTLCEEQLKDGRDWFLDTEMPGYVDASMYFPLTWMRSFRNTRPVFNIAQFPRTVSWLNRMDTILKAKKQACPAPLTKISGADAAMAIFSAPFLDISSVGFDETDAKRLGLKLGTRISVWPNNKGKDVGTVGTLVALSPEELVLETEAAAGGPGSIRVHFPRLEYGIEAEHVTQARL